MGEIQRNLGKLGLIGEETNRLLLYLAMTSRKMGRLSCAPVFPKRMPVTMPSLSVSIIIEWSPTAVKTPISATSTVPVA